MDDEALLLALLNSAPVVDGVPHEQLDIAWLREHGGVGTLAELRVTREGRAFLQAVIRGAASASALNALLDGVSSWPSVGDDGVTWTLETPPGRALVARAVLAWDALRASSPGRLRPCANDECVLFLVDHSKSNSARWCSMAVCGNRLKARRHHQRSRTASG
jgi:predicted RNA-binding Zn ribbon-like protein